MTITPVPIPAGCVDGFIEAFYARPEQLLRPEVRAAQSAWANAAPAAVERGVARLRDALASGAWDERHGRLRSQPWYEGSLPLVVACPSWRRSPAP